jgi:hypothetical protein
MRSKNHYEVGDLWKISNDKDNFLFLVLEVDIDIGIRVTGLDTDKVITIFNGSRYDERAIKVS